MCDFKIFKILYSVLHTSGATVSCSESDGSSKVSGRDRCESVYRIMTDNLFHTPTVIYTLPIKGALTRLPDMKWTAFSL